MRTAVERWVHEQADRFRRGGRDSVFWALRLTVAAVAAWLVATVIFPGAAPLLSPLTALLVVQVTPMSLLASGADRVVAVVAGVSLAIVFADVLPLSWWSLGLLIAAAIMLGQVLGLRDNLVEVAISAMLVLGVGSLGADAAAWQRITQTLVGAAVGILANLVFPSKVASEDAGRAIDDLAERLGALLTRAADQLDVADPAGPAVSAQARGWLEDARQITYDVPGVSAALLRAEQGRWLNVRAAGTADVGPGLRQGMEATEHSAVAVRSMFRAVLDATYDAGWPIDEVGVDVLRGLAQVFRELAAGLETFGELVRVEADPHQRDVSGQMHRAQLALDGLREARARLDDLLLMETGPVLFELHAAVLTTVKRLTSEMDLDERVRQQLRLVRAVRPRISSRAPARVSGPMSAAEDRPPVSEHVDDLPTVAMDIPAPSDDTGRDGA